MKKLIRILKKWFKFFRCYVILDPADNSVTLSKRLFTHIRKNIENDSTEVFVFFVPVTERYAFMPEPGFGYGTETQITNIQYNPKYKCIGFETLCPSVGKILYDYGLPADETVEMSVAIKKTVKDKYYYEIIRP